MPERRWDDLDSGDYFFGYIAAWQKEKNALETLKLSGNSIQKTARTILDGLDAYTLSGTALQIAA